MQHIKGDIKIETKGKLTFPGGIHPPENKELTENCAIEPGPNPKQLQILLSQHLGVPCQPLVNKKDTVTANQVIGKTDAFVSAGVHSPVNGTVKEVALASHPVIGREMSVVIDVDPESSAIQLPDITKFTTDFDETAYEPEQIRIKTGDAGVVGMGGAGFPTRVKMEPNPNTPLDTIIVNACECEPYITCDYRMMLEWADKLIAGVKLIRQATSCEKVFIGIEDNKPQAVKLISEKVKISKNCKNIKVVSVKTKYPQGGERQLIRSILNKDVPTGGIPPMIGVLVCNVATAIAVADAVVLDTPLTHRVVTVSGTGINKVGNFYCAVGTTVGDLVEFCGGLKDDAVKIIMGGPMMGFAVADMSTPLTKTSGSVLALTKKEIGTAKFQQRQTPCIRCGRCLNVCPVNINPTIIAHAVKNDMLDKAKENYMNSCIECGCCSYVCPANIEITGYIKTGKILDARKKKLMPE